MLGAGFGDLGQAKRTQPSAGAQILEQLKGPGLGPLPSSQAAPPVSTQGSNASICRLPGLGAPVPPPSSSSWDIKASESSATSLSSQFSREWDAHSAAMQPRVCVLVTFINVGICVFLVKVLVLCLYFVCAQVSLACSQSLLLC